jgi:hypothetical protein
VNKHVSLTLIVYSETPSLYGTHFQTHFRWDLALKDRNVKGYSVGNHAMPLHALACQTLQINKSADGDCVIIPWDGILFSVVLGYQVIY